MSVNTPDSLTAGEQVEIAQPKRSKLVHSTTRKRWWLWVLMLALAVIIGVVLVRWQTQRAAAVKSRDTAAPLIPVAVAQAHKGDIPLYINALGSATPFNTVTVR